MVESVMSGSRAVSYHPLSGNTIKTPCRRYSYLSRAPRTATGDGERPTSVHRSSQDLSDRRVSGWTQISSFEGIDALNIEQTQWRDYEIPKELEMVQAGTPLEIRMLITASLDKHRATKVDSIDRQVSQSLGNGNVVGLETDIEPSLADRSNGRSTRATSEASNTSLTSYGTASEEILSRSSVSSIPSVGLKPEPNPQTPAQRTPGLPKVTMGPLGWIMTWEEGEKPQSWWRRRIGLKKPKGAIGYDQDAAHDKAIPKEPPIDG